jgi:hypothetical protein
MVLILFGAAFVPSQVVPWPWAARTLEERREEFAYVALIILAASSVSFLLLLMT